MGYKQGKVTVNHYETTVEELSEARRRVEQGAALLDSIPDTGNWRSRIDAKALDLQSSYMCLLGQAFKENPQGTSGFNYAVTVFPELKGDSSAYVKYGFMTGTVNRIFVKEGALTQAWVDYLKSGSPLLVELTSRHADLQEEIASAQAEMALITDRIRLNLIRLRELNHAIGALSDLDRSNNGSPEDAERIAEGTEED